MSWEPPFSTGSERAEPTGLRRLLRQPSTRRKLAAGAVALVALLLLLPRGASADRSFRPPFSLQPAPSSSPGESESLHEPETMVGTPVEEAPPLPAPTNPGEALPLDSERAVYTIYLYKLPGLAPDARPGTSLDIWVTWKPPLTQRPKVQLLLEGVRLGRIETGFERGPVADLLVDDEDVPDLIYGERFGSFNATTSAG